MAENEFVKEKTFGLNIAALVLGIVSLVLWCFWFISIPCAILALIFGIVGIKKSGKAMGITGIITSIVNLFTWMLVFIFAFMAGFITAIEEELDDDDYDYSPRYSSYYDEYDF